MSPSPIQPGSEPLPFYGKTLTRSLDMQLESSSRTQHSVSLQQICSSQQDVQQLHLTKASVPRQSAQNDRYSLPQKSGSKSPRKSFPRKFRTSSSKLPISLGMLPSRLFATIIFLGERLLAQHLHQNNKARGTYTH